MAKQRANHKPRECNIKLRTGFLARQVPLTPETIVTGPPSDSVCPVAALHVTHNPYFNSVAFRMEIPFDDQIQTASWYTHHSNVRWYYRDQPLSSIDETMFGDKVDMIADDKHVFVVEDGSMPGSIPVSTILDLTYARTNVLVL